jgi:hypothetical protein
VDAYSCPKQATKRTKATDVQPPGIDGRSTWAKRLRVIAEGYANDIGG